MNPLVKEQLKKVKCAKLPPYDDSTLHLRISMGIKQESEEFAIGHSYTVRVDDALVDPESSWYKTIHGNWNAGAGLSEQFLTITVISFIGKMVKVTAVGTLVPEYTWEGFLPKSNIAIIEEVSA